MGIYRPRHAWQFSDSMTFTRAGEPEEPCRLRHAEVDRLLEGAWDERREPLHDRQHPHELFMELAEIEWKHKTELQAEYDATGDPDKFLFEI